MLKYVTNTFLCKERERVKIEENDKYAAKTMTASDVKVAIKSQKGFARVSP